MSDDLDPMADVIDVIESVAELIPYVRTALNIYKSYHGYREALLLKRLRALVCGLHVNDATVEKIRMMMDDDLQKAGELAFLVVDKATSEEKARLCGYMLRALLDEIVTRDEYFRLMHTVDVAYIGDLTSFLELEVEPRNTDDLLIARLVPSGLTWQTGLLKYSTTELGYIFRRACHHAQKLSDSPPT